MYKVLLVDDEPLILSGIKFMIDWEQEDCRIVGTATNGQAALEAIAEYHPDIVVADINMPVMDGITLLEKASRQHPNLVFIMLTNLEDFTLAKNALRLQATDYLVKTELEPETLIESVGRAKKEVDQRTHFTKANLAKDYQQADQQEIFNSALRRFVTAGPLTDQTLEVLQSRQVVEHYGVVVLQITQLVPDSTPKDYHHWMEWLEQAADELAGRSFTQHQLLSITPDKSYLVHWGSPQAAFDLQISVFVSKLQSTAQTLLNVQPAVQYTQVKSKAEQRQELLVQLQELEDYFYNTQREVLAFSQVQPLELQPLLLQGVSGKLRASLNSRSLHGSVQIISGVIEQVESTPHRRTEIIWICEELYRTLVQSLDVIPTDEAQRQVAHQIAQIATKSQAVEFLTTLQHQLETDYSPHSTSQQDALALAKAYVHQHLHEKISLQEVAEYAGISPNYLSSLFKQEYHQNFVDYVNSSKVERAKELLAQERYRVNEISYQLGFENAYYFSRVFRKHTGMSPTEYVTRQKAEQDI